MLPKLAVIFPGLGYGPDRPLLYYAGKLAAGAGYELVRADYGQLPRVDRPSGGRVDEAGLEECIRLALEHAASQLDGFLDGKAGGEGGSLLFISKSIGTAVGAAYAALRNLHPRQLLYTPVRKTFLHPLGDSVAFHGTCDPWLGNKDCEDLCRAASVPLHTFEGANHSLECGDVLRDIGFLSEAMRITEAFIKGLPSSEPVQAGRGDASSSAASRVQFGRNWRTLQGREDAEMLREKTAGWSSSRGGYGDEDYN